MKFALKTLNKELAKLGQVELVKGEGYFYFNGKSVDQCKEQGVYGVYRLNDLTIEQWIEEAKSRFVEE